MRHPRARPLRAVAEVPAPARDRAVGIARRRAVEADLLGYGAGARRQLRVGDRGAVAAGGQDRRDRGLVVDVAVVDPADPDDAHVARGRDESARRDGADVVDRVAARDRLARPRHPAVRGLPGLDLVDAADTARQVDGRGVLVIERDPGRVVGLLAVEADRAAGRGDLRGLPSRPGPARVHVAVVARGGERGEHDDRAPRGVDRDVVDPCLARRVVDGVGLARRDRRPEARDARAVGPEDAARPVGGVVDVDVGDRSRMGVREGEVDRVDAVGVVLDVRPLARDEDQRPGRRPRGRAVGLGRERGVVVAAPPEQVARALRAQVDRVRIRVALRPRRVDGDRERRVPRRDVLRVAGRPVVHEVAVVGRVEDPQAAVREDLDRRVGVVVDLQPGREHDRRPRERHVVVGGHLDVAVLRDPADVRPLVRPVIADSARVGEPGPGAVTKDALRARRRPCQRSDHGENDARRSDEDASGRKGGEVQSHALRRARTARASSGRRAEPTPTSGRGE